MKATILWSGIIAAAVMVTGQCATLKVGDPAPKLQTGKWVQGEAVKELSKDKAYIVEFWATWCGPCVATIPHLNEIHAKFKDKGLVVIGQNVWERDETKVEPFVKKMGAKMTYRVAMDDKTQDDAGAMATTWMRAAGQDGIPAAFLVGKDGKIAWIGHPGQLKDGMVEEVLAGKFDVKKAAEEAAKAKEQQEATMKLSEKLSEAMEAKDYDKAEAVLDEILKTLPAEQREQAEMFRARILLMAGKLDRAAAVAEKASAKLKAPEELNQIAWMLATAKDIKGPALEVAVRIGDRANSAAEGKDAAILDTVARLAFLQGKKDKAIELQQKAVSLANDEIKSQLQETLDSYKAGKLPPAEEM